MLVSTSSSSRCEITKNTSFGTVRNPIKNRRERSKLDTGSTHLYDRALSVVSRVWQVGDVPWAPLEGGTTERF